MNDRLINTPFSIPADEFREEQGRTPVTAFFLGTAILAASIILGHKYAAIPILVLAPFINYI